MPDLYALLAQGKPIYVTNHSGGVILLEFKRPGARTMPFEAQIPPISDHPMNVATLVPYPIIKEDSTTLFTWLSKGMLKLHDPEKVEAKYKEDPELQAAVDEVVRKKNSRQGFVPKDLGFTTAPGSTEQANAVFGKDIDPVERSLALKQAHPSPSLSPEASPKIRQMVASLLEDASLQQEVLTNLRVLDKDQLTESALGYVITSCKSFPSIVKWAKGALAKKKGGESSED